MAAITYSGESLIADVRRRAMIPNSTSVLSDDDILSFLNDEMLEYIVPLLIGTAEEYLVVSSESRSSDEALIDENGGRYFNIPDDAVGGKLRDFQVQSINSWISLPRVEPENASQFFTYGALQGYLFQGKRAYLVPIPTAAATLRFLYYKRPEKIIDDGNNLSSNGYAGERIPSDLWPLLVQRAVVRCLEALGDERAEAAEARCARVEAKCIELISPRGEGAPRVITNFWGPGWTYRRRGYYWGR
jgi:hypothetical protein